MKQIELAREIGVERFFADPQLQRQIIHGYTAEAVIEEVTPGGIDNALPDDTVLSLLSP